MWEPLSGQCQLLGGRAICEIMCKRHAGKNDLPRQKKGTSSDTERSLVFLSISVHVGFLFLSQQWQLWQLEVWQLSYFVCLNEIVPLFFFSLASWTLKNTCCEAVTCWDLIWKQDVDAGVWQKSLHGVTVVGIVVAGTCCSGRRCLCFNSFPIHLLFSPVVFP